MMAILRRDLKADGTAVPIDYGKYYFRGSKPLKYRWLADVDGFQVFFRGQWREAYSIDFDFI